jgi:lipase
MSAVGKQPNGIRVTRHAQGRVRGDGLELAFGYWPGRGAPVVALHGLTASHVNYIGVAEKLAGRRPIFALDLRGRGDSDKPEGPYGMAQHARDVAAAMRAMGLGPSVVVGHSMGAFVAAALAVNHPEAVSGVVLIDGGSVLELPTGVTAQQGLNAALAQRVMQLNDKYPSRQAYKEFWRAKPHFPPTDWNPWVEEFLDYEISGESTVQPKASATGVCADLAEGFKRDEITARLQAIRVPVLFIRATSGFTPDQPPLYSDASFSQIQGWVPQVAGHKIPDTTHYTIVLGERGATKIADLISDFAAASPGGR